MDLGKKGVGPGEQDWGYIKVRPGANMFWWLYYTTANVTHYRDRKFTEFSTVPSYIFGESYGGKMAIEFALQIHNVTKIPRKVIT